MKNRKLPRNVAVLKPIEVIVQGVEDTYERRKLLEQTLIEHMKSRPMSLNEAMAAKATLMAQLDALPDDDRHRDSINEALAWFHQDEMRYFTDWHERKTNLQELVKQAIEEDEARRLKMCEDLVAEELANPNEGDIPTHDWLLEFYADLIEIDDDDEVKFFVKYNSNQWVFPLGIRFPIQVPNVTGINDGDNLIPDYKKVVESLNSKFINKWIHYFSRSEVWKRVRVKEGMV